MVSVNTLGSLPIQEPYCDLHSLSSACVPTEAIHCRLGCEIMTEWAEEETTTIEDLHSLQQPGSEAGRQPVGLHRAKGQQRLLVL